MLGELRTYDDAERLVFFDSSSSASRVVLFIGGLGDGLNAVPYLSSLASALDAIDCSLVQVLTSSSYQGWGMGDVERDARELTTALRYLRHRGRRVVLLGHSTGCQDAVQLFKQTDDAADLACGIILQAPVSYDTSFIGPRPHLMRHRDRENSHQLATDAEISQALVAARALVTSGDGDLPFLHPVAQRIHGRRQPISAARFISLNAVDGDEDFFSSDLLAGTLSRHFAALVGTPTVFVIGEQDETMPSEVDKPALLQRFCKACPSASPRSRILAGANHCIEDGEAERAFVTLVVDVVQDVLGKAV
jgi:pimeloyl-ACP methyl ester carboxylesterase